MNGSLHISKAGTPNQRRMSCAGMARVLPEGPSGRRMGCVHLSHHQHRHWSVRDNPSHKWVPAACSILQLVLGRACFIPGFDYDSFGVRRTLSETPRFALPPATVRSGRRRLRAVGISGWAAARAMVDVPNLHKGSRKPQCTMVLRFGMQYLGHAPYHDI